MEKLSLSLDRELSIMEKYRLTAEEWLATQLLLLGSSDERKSEDYLRRYLRFPKDQRSSFIKLIESLRDKGLIDKSYKLSPENIQRFDPESVPLTKKFYKDFFKCSGELGYEMFNAYPVYVEGYILTNISKKFNSYEDLFYEYGRAVKFNPDIHKHAMEMLEWGKSNNMIRYGVCEYVISRKWEELERLKRDGIEGERCIIEAI